MRDVVRMATPPEHLIFKVLAHPEVENYEVTSKRFAGEIEKILTDVGVSMKPFRKILDFGCGCGRTLQTVAAKAENAEMFGTDIDTEAIRWCREHVRNVSLTVNGVMPPLPYERDLFDFVYAMSVFTHIDESHELAWLEEIERVLRPGGVFLFTTHGRTTVPHLSDEQREWLARTGFLFDDRFDHWGPHGFPSWYQTSYHTREYVERKTAGMFSFLSFVEDGIHTHMDKPEWLHDVFVLRKRG